MKKVDSHRIFQNDELIYDFQPCRKLGFLESNYHNRSSLLSIQQTKEMDFLYTLKTTKNHPGADIPDSNSEI